jgi:hypothetical protein
MSKGRKKESKANKNKATRKRNRTKATVSEMQFEIVTRRDHAVFTRKHWKRRD